MSIVGPRQHARSFDPDKVPDPVVPLLALADQWGVGDDIERARLVEAASPDELAALIDAVDAVDDDALYGWLSGDESYDARPSPEYIAITNVTMAADQARVRLRG
jgi:hypothetical protein